MPKGVVVIVSACIAALPPPPMLGACSPKMLLAADLGVRGIGVTVACAAAAAPMGVGAPGVGAAAAGPPGVCAAAAAPPGVAKDTGTGVRAPLAMFRCGQPMDLWTYGTEMQMNEHARCLTRCASVELLKY